MKEHNQDANLGKEIDSHFDENEMDLWSQYDAYDFSEEDRRNQRRPNPQPIDGDYFSVENLAEYQQMKKSQSENEFRYHSIKEDLIKHRKEKSRVHKKNSFFSDLFKPTYEEYYSLDKLESIQAYDQFNDGSQEPSETFDGHKEPMVEDMDETFFLEDDQVEEITNSQLAQAFTDAQAEVTKAPKEKRLSPFMSSIKHSISSLKSKLIDSSQEDAGPHAEDPWTVTMMEEEAEWPQRDAYPIASTLGVPAQEDFRDSQVSQEVQTYWSEQDMPVSAGGRDADAFETSPATLPPSNTSAENVVGDNDKGKANISNGEIQVDGETPASSQALETWDNGTDTNPPGAESRDDFSEEILEEVVEALPDDNVQSQILSQPGSVAPSFDETVTGEASYDSESNVQAEYETEEAHATLAASESAKLSETPETQTSSKDWINSEAEDWITEEWAGWQPFADHDALMAAASHLNQGAKGEVSYSLEQDSQALIPEETQKDMVYSEEENVAEAANYETDTLYTDQAEGEDLAFDEDAIVEDNAAGVSQEGKSSWDEAFMAGDDSFEIETHVEEANATTTTGQSGQTDSAWDSLRHQVERQKVQLLKTFSSFGAKFQKYKKGKDEGEEGQALESQEETSIASQGKGRGLTAEIMVAGKNEEGLAAIAEGEIAKEGSSDLSPKTSQEATIEDSAIEEGVIKDATREEREIVATTRGQEAESLSHIEDDLSEFIAQSTMRYQSPILTDAVLEETLGQDDIRIEKFVESPKDEITLIKQSSFVSGAAWLTVGNIISRVIGALYVIPWATWLGESWTQGNTLYSVGYKPYSLFLAIATAGFPSAIAKQMALHHSQKEYRAADKLFKYSLLVMIATGLFAGALLYFAAPVLASQSPTVNVDGAIMVIRSLVPALVILPVMSILRGYFQGFNDMRPTAISQILEQFARVGYMLAATYAIMMLYNGEVTAAVVHSTFAAFVGAIISLAYLILVYIRRLSTVKKLIAQSADHVKLSFSHSLVIMVKDSIPFIILGSGIIIAQLIDTYTFSQILRNTSILLLKEISELYGVLSLDVDKLIMIVISLAIALSTAFVPSLTSIFAKRDIPGTSNMVRQIITVFAIVMIPSAIGMAAIADNVYWLFYPEGSEIGPSLLVTASLCSMILGLYTVLSTILQSMNYRRVAVRFLIVGLLVKALLQFPLVALLQAHGAVLSTALGLLVSSIFMWIKLRRELEMDTYRLSLDLVKIIVPAILMGIAALMWNNVFNLAFGEVGRWATLGKIVLVIILGVIIYGGAMAVQGMLSVLLGNKYEQWQEKLRIRL